MCFVPKERKKENCGYLCPLCYLIIHTFKVIRRAWEAWCSSCYHIWQLYQVLVPTGRSGMEETFPSLPAPPEALDPVQRRAPAINKHSFTTLIARPGVFIFYIMGLSSASGFLHHLSESQVELNENSSRLRHEWMFSTFLPLWRCCLLDGDERRISEVDQKEGGGNAKDEWAVQLNSVCFFSGLFLPAVFHCCCQRCRLCLRLKAVGGSAVSPQPWWL